MTHLSEEDLATFHWEGGRSARAHLASCTACADRLEELRALLRQVESMPVPERGESYGREVWARLVPRLPGKPEPFRGWLSGWRSLAAAGAIAALVAAAFLAGRLAAPSPASIRSAQALASRQRVLFIDLGEHLDRSGSILLELVNAPPSDALDVSAEQARLSDLLPANRLYRQSALRAGDPAVSGLLDDLERVLLDVAHGPSRLTPAERESLRRRIETDGVLFRLRVLGSRVREQERTLPAFSGKSVIERKRA